MLQKIHPMALRGWREATTAPTTEKVSTVARLRTATSSSALPPYASPGTVAPVVRDNAIPPRRRDTDSVTSDQASHEAARRPIPPTSCSCSLASAVIASPYTATASQALLQTLRGTRSL